MNKAKLRSTKVIALKKQKEQKRMNSALIEMNKVMVGDSSTVQSMSVLQPPLRNKCAGNRYTINA